MRTKMRNTFEIVAAREEGYRWRLVADGCQLAESAKSYRSPKRVRRAIAAMRRAEVVDLTSDEPREIALPEARFALVEGVEPLIVGIPSRRRKPKRDDDECAADEEGVADDLESHAVEEVATAGEPRHDAAAAGDGDEEAAGEAGAKATMADARESDPEEKAKPPVAAGGQAGRTRSRRRPAS